jgi:putative heme-binding domain-containing protein
VLAELASLIGVQARQNEVLAVLKVLEEFPEDGKPQATALLVGLTEGLARSGSPLRAQIAARPGKAKALLGDLLATARRTAADESITPAQRVEAIRTLGLGTFGESRDILPGLLGARQPQEVQLATVGVLGRFTDREIPGILIEQWPTFGPKLRTVALEALFSRGEWLVEFLGAVEKESIPVSDLEPARVRLLESHASAAVREKAKGVAARLKLGRRQDVLDDYKSSLTLTGEAAKGKVHFQKVCAVCHRLDNVGTEIGPNLATLQNRGAEAILLNLLDPNREVNPQYVNYVLVTTDGKSITGIVAAETATSVTLKRQENATDTILRANIDELRSTGLSIMPEGLEKQLDQQAVADLIAYLLSVK